MERYPYPVCGTASTVGDTNNTTFRRRISGGGSLTKIGSGMLVLTVRTPT